nr:aldehyde dehydrogenase family protein [Antarctobacter heliothermus]
MCRHRQHHSPDAKDRSSDLGRKPALFREAGSGPARRHHSRDALQLHFVEHEPYGVVARIAPFNHPIMFAVARTAAALAVGNAVIVKPPETSSLSATVLADIVREVLPQGLFNIVTGDGKGAGNAIARHPDIKRIAFIGSPETGRLLQRSAAEAAVKHISLELGGKNPMIVFPDCDPDVRPGMHLWQREVFGPVMAIGRWSNFCEAVSLTNSTEFGLTAAIGTHDLDDALGMARRVRSGHIWINGSSAHFPGVPFGSMGSSGVGREEGRDELLTYTEAKSINVMLRPRT